MREFGISSSNKQSFLDFFALNIMKTLSTCLSQIGFTINIPRVLQFYFPVISSTSINLVLILVETFD